MGPTVMFMTWGRTEAPLSGQLCLLNSKSMLRRKRGVGEIGGFFSLGVLFHVWENFHIGIYFQNRLLQSLSWRQLIMRFVVVMFRFDQKSSRFELLT